MIKILFVHPDQKLVQLYAKDLSQNFSFDSALDGLTALRKLKYSKPGLVVSNFDLAYLSGLGLLKFMRADFMYASIPFIFLTNGQDTQQALSMGANDWLDLPNATPKALADKIYYHIKLTHTYGV